MNIKNMKYLGELHSYSNNKYDFDFTLFYDEKTNKYYINEHGCPNKMYMKYYDELNELTEDCPYYKSAIKIIGENIQIK